MYSMNTMMTESDIKQYIQSHVPGISSDDLWRIRNRFIYDFVPLEVGIAEFIREIQMKAWSRSKDKHYYRITKSSGAMKYMCACEAHVKYACECNAWNYELVG